MYKKSIMIFTTIALSTLTTFPSHAMTFDDNNIAIVENNSLYNEINEVVSDIVSIPLLENDEASADEVTSSEEEINEKVIIEDSSEMKSKSSSIPVEPNYIAVYSMESTAYTGGGITASGVPVSRNPDGLSTVAVDPNVIPLGSLLHIPGYGYAVAADTGGAIIGNIVDIYLNTYEECISWGRRHITVNLVAYPGQW